MHVKRFIISILLLGWLTGCAADFIAEPTPIAPPPNSSNAENDQSETANTPEPSPLPLLEETAVDPTPTIEPTATPTAEPPPTTNPSALTEPLPATSRDLLFIANGSFRQWNHTTRQIEIIVAGTNGTNLMPENQNGLIVGDITSFVMSADGKRAVVARILNAANAPEVQNAPAEYSYELLFVDMISREVWTLVPQVDNFQGFDLSPDAQQLAFVASGIDGIPDATNNEPIPTSLFVMETGGGNPANLRQVHHCQRNCRAPKWHIENNLVAFGDDEALWLYNIAASEPEILFQNRPFNAEMNDVNDVSVYWPEAWARNGRMLMLWHGGWEGGSRAVLDLPTGNLAEVPNSFIYADLFPTQVSWMPDDRILIWRTESSQEGSFIPLVELWRFDLGNGDLILDESARLSGEMLGVMGGIALENGRFAFALDAPPAEDGNAIQSQFGTYLLTSLAEVPERVNALPPSDGVYRQSSVLWAANGSGALLIQADRPNQPKLFYAAANGDELVEVTAVFGQNAHAFQWQPEIIVP